MKTIKIFDVTEKARIYHILAQMSSSFSSIIRYCADLEQAGALTSKAKNRFQAFTVEVQGELNLEVLEHMDAIETQDIPDYCYAVALHCEYSGELLTVCRRPRSCLRRQK
jgi:hypothetical protein